MFHKLAYRVICAWCGFNTSSGRTMKDGRIVCALCIMEATQD